MKPRILFLLLLAAITNYSKAQIITTIAGNGTLDSTGNRRLATVLLFNPGAVLIISAESNLVIFH